MVAEMGMLVPQQYLNRRIYNQEKFRHFAAQRKGTTLLAIKLTISSCQEEHLPCHVPRNLIHLEKEVDYSSSN